MTAYISDHHRQLALSFDELKAELQVPTSFDNQLSVKDILNDIDRYQVWADNVGASKYGNNYNLSLDYRFREAPFYKDQVVRLLERLNKIVRKVLEVLRGSRRPFDEIYTADVEKKFIEDDELSSDSDSSSATDSDWAISSSEDDTDSRQLSGIQASGGFAELEQQKRPLKEVPQLFFSLKLTITSLYKIPIRRPAPVERLDRWVKTSSNETSLWEHYDFIRVRDIFNQADENLLRRLGRMNTRRRLLLQYRQTHNERLKQDIGDSREVISDNKSIQDSQATTFKPPTHHFDFATENFEMQSFSDSLSSFATTQMGEELPAFPSPPKGPSGEELEDFICPYCCVICHITSSHDWERHVLSDLEPYVCTFGKCVRTNDMFRSREDWYNHEMQQHRLEYSCNMKNHERYPDIRDFKSHMGRDHNIQIDDEQTQSQLSMFSRPTQRKSGVCPLCMKSTKHLKRHLARHLERIALYALPRQPDTEFDPSGDDTSKENVADSRSTEGFIENDSSRNNDGDRKPLSPSGTDEPVMKKHVPLDLPSLLVQNGIDPSMLSEKQTTALQQGIENPPNPEYVDALLLLTQNGIDISTVSRQKVTAFSEQGPKVQQRVMEVYKSKMIEKSGSSSVLHSPLNFNDSDATKFFERNVNDPLERGWQNLDPRRRTNPIYAPIEPPKDENSSNPENADKTRRANEIDNRKSVDHDGLSRKDDEDSTKLPLARYEGRTNPRWDEGQQMWMRAAPGAPFQYLVSIIKSEYDELRGGWKYTVEFARDKAEYPGLVEESNLRRT